MLLKLRLSRLVTQAQHDRTQALRRRGSRSLSAVSRVPGHQAAHLATPRDCPPLPLGPCLSTSSARALSVAPLRGLGVAGCPCSPLCRPRSLHTAGHQPCALKPERCRHFSQLSFFVLGFFFVFLLFVLIVGKHTEWKPRHLSHVKGTVQRHQAQSSTVSTISANRSSVPIKHSLRSPGPQPLAHRPAVCVYELQLQGPCVRGLRQASSLSDWTVPLA